MHFGLELDPAARQVRAETRNRILRASYNREYRDGYAHGSIAWRNALAPGTLHITDVGLKALQRILLAHEGKRAPYSKGLSDCLRAALKLD